MKLERLIGILMILLHERQITAKSLANRFSVSVRTVQRDIDILSVAGIPVTALKGPAGGYGLLEEYTIDKAYLKKDELKLLADLLGGLERLLRQVGFTGIREKVNAVSGKEPYLNSEKLRFDFIPWLPQQALQEKLIQIFDAINNHMLAEMDYRDQKGNVTHRRIEPYQLVMKDYAWYVYGYCPERNGFRYFKVVRIDSLKVTKVFFKSRPVLVEEPFAGLKDKLIDLKLKFSLSAIGRIEDYFPQNDIQYLGDHILVQTQYPDDFWLYQTLLSFGKELEVIEPEHIRKRLQEEAQDMLRIYS
jgi:predicted DNA-binding transcriptional regulator YafY